MDNLDNQIIEFFEGLEFDHSFQHELPLGEILQSRICVAEILSFAGRGQAICKMLQNLSKRGRAFIIS